MANGAFARPEDALVHAFQLFAHEQRLSEFNQEQKRLALTAGEPMEGDLEAIREGLADVGPGERNPSRSSWMSFETKWGCRSERKLDVCRRHFSESEGGYSIQCRLMAGQPVDRTGWPLVGPF